MYQFAFYSLIEGHLYCFQFEAIKIKLLGAFEHFVPLYDRTLLLLLGKCLGVEWMDHMTVTYLVF